MPAITPRKNVYLQSQELVLLAQAARRRKLQEDHLRQPGEAERRKQELLREAIWSVVFWASIAVFTWYVIRPLLKLLWA